MKGLGVMLQELGGGNRNSAEKYYGKKIRDAIFENDMMQLLFDDGITIAIKDHGQSCCEHRYMTCDDDVKSLVGQELRKIEVKDGGRKDDKDYGDHEICFLEIQGDKSSISFATHNEHNGYYGGFSLQIEEAN